MPRKNSIIAVSVSDANVLTFAVADAGSFDVDVPALDEALRNRAMLHGIVQKVSDAAAIAKSELTGDAVKDAATKLAAMSSVAERLVAGDWSKRSGDGSGPVAGIIYRAFEEWVGAMAAKAKKDVPDATAIRAKYDTMDRAGQLALRNVPAIAKIIDRIKSERPAKEVANVDTSALLGELGL